jgi:hypothetical protein
MGTDIGTRVLAEFTSITFYGIKSMITVTALFPVLIVFHLGNTLGSMQTDMISSWTNFKLMLALNAKGHWERHNGPKGQCAFG